MSMLYWNIGHKINEEILGNKRNEYGKQIVLTLSAQLKIVYGDSFSDKSMVVSLVRQLTWTQLLAVIPMMLDGEGNKR